MYDCRDQSERAAEWSWEEGGPLEIERERGGM